MTPYDEMIQDSLSAARHLEKRSRPLLAVFSALALCGAVGFLYFIAGPHAARAWQAYLVNFVFWTGLSLGALLFVAIMNMTNARWSRPVKRLAEAPGAFLPVACLLFAGLYAGRAQLFPWIHEPAEGKQLWLSAGFLFARDGAGLLLLTGLALVLIYWSVRDDRKALAETAPASREFGKQPRLQAALSAIFGIAYAVVLSLVAFDLIMSLDPHWVSTLFGAYYFIGCFYAALAGLVILCGFSRSLQGLGKYITPRQFQDLGKLLLGFCLVTGDFFYSQFLVIWYANLPEETRYVILRVRSSTWEPLAWIVLAGCFAGPFLVLLNRRIKMKPAAMMLLGCVIVAGMWLERLLLIAPSLWKGSGLPLGIPELLISGGFLGAMAVSVLVFLRRVPLLPLSDPLFVKQLNAARAENGERLL